MTRLLPTLALAALLGLPMAARADEASDRIEAAKALVQKTVIKNLETGFTGALEKTVAAMPAEKSDKVRQEVRAEFDRQRTALIEGLSKEYADKFTLDEIKHLSGIYDDKIYQKFQAINADPGSTITLISQAAVTKLVNMLTVAAAADAPGLPGQAPGPAPTPAPAR
ncbi:hypothetical protein ASG40_12500 [Methylobacterium sp. Leaf399]|uniref:hypothetical protein n=1 Tax=unclassified Methylobacterium TaxID=2615210 RepID=UPI0006F88DBA|nr:MULTISPECIES: hypothetical protein [unclassified Methylobacterium]KQP50420.1 hypothetical protein ASF39_12030 [Methylobacterium sp. Leaf108]KQT08684.1 hypothetical protein ASG40_12500 [Methylobacterium sp. Leaf399]KQT78666.1 hypothetical protein ASG59_05590 [Methylobacterium sp. Leaf466]